MIDCFICYYIYVYINIKYLEIYISKGTFAFEKWHQLAFFRRIKTWNKKESFVL